MRNTGNQEVPRFVVIHTVEGFSVVNEAQVDVFLESSWFFYDSLDVGSLISGSSAFSKSTLYLSKFLIHVLLKPCLKDSEYYLASMWNEKWSGSLNILWHCPSLWLEWKTDLFQSCIHCWAFQMCWHTECSILTASSFRIWNSSAGIPSPPLALFIVMLPKAHLSSHTRMSGPRWLITPPWLSGH